MAAPRARSLGECDRGARTDLRRLKENWNKTYDDTMYLVLRRLRPAEVYEYRMTTESSSESKGGPPESKQVTYVRGKHRGTDPGYRLQGGRPARGSGSRRTTNHRANIHSAYSKAHKQ